MVKPLVPRINWNNPITKGLVLDASIFEGGGSSPIETIYKRAGSLSGTSVPTWKVDQPGNCLDFDGVSGDDLLTYNLTTKQRTPVQFSVHALVLQRGFGANNAGCICRVTDNTSSVWALRADSTNGIIFQGNWSASTSSTAQWKTTALSNNVWSDILVTYDSTSTSNSPMFYQNGVQMSSSVVVAASGTYGNTNDTQFLIGNINQTGNALTRTWNGRIAAVEYWMRILNPQEAKSLYTNPWQIYTRPNFYQPLNSISSATAVKMQTMRGWSWAI